MKLSSVPLFQRIVIDLGTVLTLAVASISISWACSFNGPLEMIGRYEHIIWALAVAAIATCRAYVEYLWRTPLSVWFRIILWMFIVIATYLLMCWIDTRMNRYDTFINVFAFGLLIFLAPSLVVSTAVYAVMSASIGRSHGNS